MKNIFTAQALALAVISVWIFNGCNKAAPPAAPVAQDTATATGTITNTCTSVNTATITCTFTFTATVTETSTVTDTATPTGTDTVTSTVTDTATPTGTDTDTPTITDTATATVTKTATATITPTNEPVCNYAFGYNIAPIDSNTSSGAGGIMGNKFVMGSGMTLSRLSIVGSPGQFCIGLYTDVSSAPGTLIAQTGIVTGAGGWMNGYITPTLVNAGTTYWLIAIIENDGILGKTGNGHIAKNAYYGWAQIVTDNGLPATLPALSNLDADMDITAAVCP